MITIESANRKLNRLSTHELLASSVKHRHQSLDQHPLLQRLLSARISLSEYVRILGLLRQCFNLIEPALVNYEKSGLNRDIVPYVCKAATIGLDLQRLGADSKVVADRIIPICIDTPGAYLGARYVLEGSARGGVFIANRLEKSLPEPAAHAFRFWDLQRQSAAQWPTFVAMLAQLDGDNPAQQHAIEAATQAFDIFLAVFAGESHE